MEEYISYPNDDGRLLDGFLVLFSVHGFEEAEPRKMHVCDECFRSLKVDRIPEVALAIGFWVGKLPAQFDNATKSPPSLVLFICFLFAVVSMSTYFPCVVILMHVLGARCFFRRGRGGGTSCMPFFYGGLFSSLHVAIFGIHPFFSFVFVWSICFSFVARTLVRRTRRHFISCCFWCPFRLPAIS